jgi:hypothetical protein
MTIDESDVKAAIEWAKRNAKKDKAEASRAIGR